MTSPDGGQAFAPLRLLVPLVARWRRLALIGLGGGVAGLVIGFLISPRFTATTRFTAQTSEGSGIGSNLAALAGRFGVDIDVAGAGGMTPQFYADVLLTREILEPVVTARYARRDGGDSVVLTDFLGASRGTDRRRVEVGAKNLARRTRVDVSRSGLVTVDVSLRDPMVAAAVANRLLAELNRLTVERLQFQSRQQRIFTEDRLRTAQTELREAEDAEARFVERNRSYQQSPTLRVELARLQRTTQVKQEIVSTLARSYEEARVQEVRDMPTLTTIEVAVPPARKSWPRRSIAAVLGALAALAVAVAWTWLADWLADARRAGRGDVLDLADAWRRSTRVRGG